MLDPESKYSALPKDLVEIACVRQDERIVVSMESLELSGLGAVCLIGSEGELVGVLTDGDIRRFLRAGGSLDQKVHQALPEKVQFHLQSHELAGLSMRFDSTLALIPVIKNGKLDALLTNRQKLRVNPDVTMILMAGGEGRRLLPLTESIPKPLVEIAGKPLILHAIENAKRSGVAHFVISIRHLGNQIKERLGNGSEFGVSIEYVEEALPLGTAGALSLIDYDSVNATVLVQNSDVLTDTEFEQLSTSLHTEEVVAAVATRSHLWQNPFGVVHEEAGNLLNIAEKPVQQFSVSAGMYAFRSSFLKTMDIPPEPLSMPDLLNSIVSSGRQIRVVKVKGYWRDVGTPEQLKSAEADFDG